MNAFRSKLTAQRQSPATGRPARDSRSFPCERRRRGVTLAASGRGSWRSGDCGTLQMCNCPTGEINPTNFLFARFPPSFTATSHSHSSTKLTTSSSLLTGYNWRIRSISTAILEQINYICSPRIRITFPLPASRRRPTPANDARGSPDIRPWRRCASG